jgi:hypothetical protein
MKPSIEEKKQIALEIEDMVNDNSAAAAQSSPGQYDDPMRDNLGQILSTKGVRYLSQPADTRTYLLKNRDVLKELVVMSEEKPVHYYFTTSAENFIEQKLLDDKKPNLDSLDGRQIDNLLGLYSNSITTVETPGKILCALYDELGITAPLQQGVNQYQRSYRTDPWKGSHENEHLATRSIDKQAENK